jgi:hypothetical protein
MSVMQLLQVLPCVIQLALLWFIGESPRFLVSRGKNEQALRTLARYHANGDEQDELVQYVSLYRSLNPLASMLTRPVFLLLADSNTKRSAPRSSTRNRLRLGSPT